MTPSPSDVGLEKKCSRSLAPGIAGTSLPLLGLIMDKFLIRGAAARGASPERSRQGRGGRRRRAHFAALLEDPRPSGCASTAVHLYADKRRTAASLKNAQMTTRPRRLCLTSSALRTRARLCSCGPMEGFVTSWRSTDRDVANAA